MAGSPPFASGAGSAKIGCLISNSYLDRVFLIPSPEGYWVATAEKDVISTPLPPSPPAVAALKVLSGFTQYLE